MLPVEVLGTVGTVRSIAVQVGGDAVGAARRLALQLHNVRYAGKASVQINEGPWIAIDNTTADMSEQTRAFGGIGGAFATLSLSVPLPSAGLVAGANTLKFRFDKANSLSMGYRVLNIDLLDGAGRGLLNQSQFAHDNPATWTAPAGGNAANGKTLWTSASLIDGPLSPKPMRARCADCHTTTGSDLKYFSYSNHSIIERAKFHGLTEQAGKDLAAYIRGLDVAAVGRPWNPPFQPGPGNTDRPVNAFSAGAGVEAVVDEDATIAAIFKNGFDRTSLVDPATGTLRRISVNDIPISLQLPDWNHWLPEIHPKDVIGEAAFNAHSVNTSFTALNNRLTEKSRDPAAMKDYKEKLFNFSFMHPNSGARSDFNGWRDAATELSWSLLPPEGGNSRAMNDLIAKQVYGSGVWSQVRTWELMNRFGLEDYAVTAYPGTGDKRAWYSERHLFNSSPGQLGIFFQDCSSGVCTGFLTGSSIGNTELHHAYLNNSWYQLQFVLNAGQRSCGGHQCMDWGYTYARFNEWSQQSSHYEGGRRLLFGLKSMEEHDTDKGPSPHDGFSFATAHIPLDLEGNPRAMAFWSDSSRPNRMRALEVSLQVWLEKQGTWTVQNWQEANYGHSEDGAHFPVGSYIIGSGNDEFQMRSQADWQWKDMLNLKNLNVHPAIVNAMGRFGLAMWPRNDWASRGFAPAGPIPGRPTLTSTSSGVTVSWPQVPGATSYNVHRATEPNGPWLSVALLRSGNTLTDKPAETGRTYYYTVSANTATTESALSQAATIRY